MNVPFILVKDLSEIINQGDGSYQAQLTGLIAGTTVNVQGLSYQQTLTSTAPQVIVVHGVAAVVSAIANNQQTGTVATLLPLPLQVLVSDTQGNPVTAGTPVSWSGVSGEGSLTTACAGSVTDSAEKAVCTPTLGNLAGSKTFTAQLAGGASGTTAATFVALALPQSTIALLDWGIAPRTTSIASDVTPLNSFSVELLDPLGNVITTNSSTTVTMSITSGGSSSGGPLTATVANGIVTFSSVTETTAGLMTLTATENTSSHTLSQNALVPPAASIAGLAWGTPPSLTYTASSSTPMPPFTAQLRDAFGNVVTTNNSTSVSVSITSGSGTLSGTQTVVVVAGVATFSALTSTSAGTVTFTATENTLSHSVSESNVIFSPGVFSLAQSQVSSSSSLVSGQSITVTLPPKMYLATPDLAASQALPSRPKPPLAQRVLVPSLT